MPQSKGANKAESLKRRGTLHPQPEAVKDDLFHSNEFFDSRDRVQVKYEMLRAHRVDGKPVVETAASFGTSRQAYYEAQRIFKSNGIAGLIAKRRGPKNAHKCTKEVLDFAEQWQTTKHDAQETLSQAVRRVLGINLHPRSIERALTRHKKKRKESRTRRAPRV